MPSLRQGLHVFGQSSGASNLNSHLKSSAHLQQKYRCPAGCDGTFISRAAVILHLEAGACPSGVKRYTVDSYVYRYDTENIFTYSYINIFDSASDRVMRYCTSNSWNGSYFECALCDAQYRTLAGLRQHLESPRHEDKIYQCPEQDCERRFSAFSALVQHFDSETCGARRLPFARRRMNGLFGGMGRLVRSPSPVLVL
ncbi:hypothetical protein CVT26_000694 [Gymnopilus dilepis]|uniref:C2H2-type domain-containing protein n=1 Tax=Gymnopilus dilepis TaxID=231916 RepID=A0A409W748_9AGAR|nr:hypothetical protein CVT26_000694 [Gymnopilus dilepis]